MKKEIADLVDFLDNLDLDDGRSWEEIEFDLNCDLIDE